MLLTSCQQGAVHICNLYRSTTNVEAIPQFSRYLSDLVDKFQSNEETFDVYPNRYGPIVRSADSGQELVRARWGMPSPFSALKGKAYDYGVTNIHNTASPHWRRWLAPQNRNAPHRRRLAFQALFIEANRIPRRHGGPTGNLRAVTITIISNEPCSPQTPTSRGAGLGRTATILSRPTGDRPTRRLRVVAVQSGGGRRKLRT